MKREGTKDVLALEGLYKELESDYIFLVGDQRISNLGHMITLDKEVGGWIPNTIRDIKSMSDIGDKREYINTVLEVMSQAADLLFYYKMLS